MAKQTRSNKSKKQRAFEEAVDERGLLEYTRDAMTVYGKYTLEDRAIPDFRDGLKPVHRRILWAAHQLGLNHKAKFMKAARLVGDAMGKYHPHGDKAVYDTAVNMANDRNPTIDGSGNWGTLVDDAAAMRYTECRMTEYADRMFFDPDYVPVIETVRNFDGTQVEPLVLPSLLPNLLLNGAYGIATGGTCSIPAFEVEGVAHLTKMAVRGKKITPKLCAEHLVPTCAEGGYAYLDEDDYEAELDRLFKTGQGSIYWLPRVEVNPDSRSMIISGFAPRTAISVKKAIEKCLSDEDVEDVIDVSDIGADGRSRLAYQVTLKKGIPAKEVEDVLWEVSSYFEASQNYVFNITERRVGEGEAGAHEVELRQVNFPEFFEAWAKWRIELERRAITHQIDQVRSKLERDELLLLAVLNREEVIRSLDHDDSEAYLVKKCKITREQATSILELKVRQLKALEEKPIRQRIKQHKADIKKLQADHKAPQARIEQAIDRIMEVAR